MSTESVESSAPLAGGAANITPKEAVPSGTSANSVIIRNLGELREKAPDVWQGTLKMLAFSMIREMRRHGQKLKEIIREGRRQQ